MHNNVRTSLALVLLAMPGLAAAAPMTLSAEDRQHLDRRMPGYTVFDPGYARRLADPFNVYDPVNTVYHAAHDILRSHRACAQLDPETSQTAREAVAAYQQLVTTQTRHVSAAQWRALEAAIPPTSVRVGADLACIEFVHGAEGFDTRLDNLLRVSRELAQESAAPEDTRSETEIPVLGVVLTAGTEIDRLFPGSAAEQAGLRRSDRILAVDGITVASMVGIAQVLRTRRPGERVALSVQRLNLEARTVDTLQLETTLESLAVAAERSGQRVRAR